MAQEAMAVAAGDVSLLDHSHRHYGRFFQFDAPDGDDNRARWVHYAARWCRVDLLAYLVQVCGLPANKPSAHSRVGATPAHDAAAIGNTDTLRWLLTHTDSNLGDVDDTGATVVHLAARYGHLRMLKWLVTEVAGGCESTHTETLSRALPLHLAAMNGHLDVVKFLVEHGVIECETDDYDSGNWPCPCSKDGHLINSQTCSGVTATYLAAQQGHLEVLRYLVEEGGASLKILCHDRKSCLQAAAQTGQLETIEWLVTCKKLDVNDRDFDGSTALHFAVGQGHTEVVQWLLQHSGKMTRDSTGGTLLHTAAEQGHIECVQLLLRCGCDPETTDNDGLTAAELADLTGHGRCADLIRRADHTALDVIDAYHDPDKTGHTDTDDATTPASQPPSANHCPICLIPPLRPVTCHPTFVSHQCPPEGTEHSVLVTNTKPIQLPGFPPNVCVPVTRVQKPCHEPMSPVKGRLTSGCQAAERRESGDRWMLASRDATSATSDERTSRDAGVPRKSPPSAVQRAEQASSTTTSDEDRLLPPPPPPPPPPPRQSSDGRATPPVRPGLRWPCADLLQELKAANGSDSLKRSSGRVSPNSVYFGRPGRRRHDTPTAGIQAKAASPKGEFDPEHFLERVPHTDTEGVVIAPWKRLIIARQMAENARHKKEAMKQKEEEEVKYFELPRWKRALILKTEAQLRERRERRLEDELETKSKRLRDPSLLLDDDGLPIPDPLDDEMSLAEVLPVEPR